VFSAHFIKAESQLPPLYTEVNNETCAYQYAFEKKQSFHSSDPIYLDLDIKKIEKYKNSYPVTEAYAYPYIFSKKSKIKKYFKREKESFFLKLKTSLTFTDRFGFHVYIYGLASQDISLHIYNMQPDNGKWKGYLADLDYILKQNKKKVKIKDMKWINDFADTTDIYALAIWIDTPLAFPQKQKVRKRPQSDLEKFDEITLTYKEKIIFLKDIYYEDQPSLSLMKKITHKPGAKENQYIIVPYDKQLLNKSVILQLDVGDKQNQLFQIEFVPGTHILLNTIKDKKNINENQTKGSKNDL